MQSVGSCCWTVSSTPLVSSESAFLDDVRAVGWTLSRIQDWGLDDEPECSALSLSALVCCGPR